MGGTNPGNMLRSLALLSVIAIGAHAAGETVTLNNGVKMPTLAFGANVWSAATCKQATSDALDAGFRFIWSSALIGQACQAAQGAAIGASSLPRASLFIAGTVNSGDCSDQASCYTETKTAAQAQFSTLNVTKLDMLMLDYPSSAGCDGITGQWKAFSELYAAGKVRAIAVSNFEGDQLTCVTKDPKGVKPTVNQLSYSVGKALDPDTAKLGIVEQAYSPLGSGGLATDPLLQGIGKGHKKSAVQVALRWILQHNASINTQSRNPVHLKSDTNIYDFVLSDAEMAQLDAHSAVQTKSTQTLKTTETAVEAQTTLYKTFKAGSGCGQATLDSKYAKYAIKFAGLSEGTCAALGYTLADGTQTLKVPVLGDITITKFKKAAVTQLEDVCVLYKLANDECFESGIIDCKFVKGAKFFDVKGFKDGTCA